MLHSWLWLSDRSETVPIAPGASVRVIPLPIQPHTPPLWRLTCCELMLACVVPRQVNWWDMSTSPASRYGRGISTLAVFKSAAIVYGSGASLAAASVVVGSSSGRFSAAMPFGLRAADGLKSDKCLVLWAVRSWTVDFLRSPLSFRTSMCAQ